MKPNSERIRKAASQLNGSTVEVMRPGESELPSLHALMEGSAVGMGYLDADLRFVEGNHALAQAFGVEDVAGLELSRVAVGARTEGLVRQVLLTGRPVSVDARAARVSYYRVLAIDGEALGIGAVALAESKGVRHLAQLKLEAETDGLTGLLNHRAFQERLLLEFTRADRHGRPLSLAVVDVDGFKQLNDTFGHQVGDDALRRVAGHLAAAVRASDTVARVGGDEFALLLPETTAASAEIVLERAHAMIRTDAAAEGVVDFTVSIGICDLSQARTPDELFRFADGALYWAKASGRDAVCQYSPETVEDLSREQRGDRLLRDTALAGIRALARAIDAKDHSTLLHSERVASLAGRLAEALGWSPFRVAALRETALIHDVGKIGVPQEVLLKPDALTPDEYDIVKSHAHLGAVISAEVLSEEQTSWLRGHHERWDGSGYPDGLAGDAIPDGALLIGLADCWDVMTSERIYSHGMTASEAIAECQRCAGGQFSPEIVAILSRPGFERVLRIFANEQATRDRNEARLAGDRGSVFRLHCECGAEDCQATVEIPSVEYRAVRKYERRYIVKIGHEIPEIEETIATTDHYRIVEKT
jgi:diguanylate cyclase (GGDEF)-like protein/putative nucleotidyltransferase with HDIG domain